MIMRLLNITPKNEDSSDALAIAISAQNISHNYDNIYSEQSNGLNVAIARALMKDENK